MPHLSPLNWLLSPLVFWLILLMFMSILWWSQSINFPKMKSSFYKISQPKWVW